MNELERGKQLSAGRLDCEDAPLLEPASHLSEVCCVVSVAGGDLYCSQPAELIQRADARFGIPPDLGRRRICRHRRFLASSRRWASVPRRTVYRRGTDGSGTMARRSLGSRAMEVPCHEAGICSEIGGRGRRFLTVRDPRSLPRGRVLGTRESGGNDRFHLTNEDARPNLAEAELIGSGQDAKGATHGSAYGYRTAR